MKSTIGAAKMNRISINLADLSVTHFDVVVIGSGYGGSIAASRLAAVGKSVCLLERGREILPGQYPTDISGAQQEIEVITARKGRLKPSANGMMQMRVNDDVNVVLGNGLGGGSLVNAGVSIEPDPRVFLDGWPKAYEPDAPLDGPLDAENSAHNQLFEYYGRVRTNLGANKLPEKVSLPKLTALEQSAKAMKQNFERADINVSFEDGPNHFGFDQKACNMCGDCCSGCNYEAKNTLLMNYLPDAARSGAVLVTQAEVHTIAPDGSNWQVNALDRTKPVAGQEPKVISAGMIVLAAGSLGSTEILGRSVAAHDALTVSSALGSKFSTNGDVLAFGFGSNIPGSNGSKDPATPLYSIGAGIHEPDAPQYQSGPCITGVVRVNMEMSNPLDHGLLIEDGTAPGLFASAYPPMLFMQEAIGENCFEYPDTAERLQGLAALGEGIQFGGDPAHLSYEGIMTQLQCYLIMSHDTAHGKLVFSDKTELVHVDWPKAGYAPVYQRDNEALEEAARAIWANMIANPIWDEGFGRKLVSVHPLGGCPMSDSDTDGVTDPDCRLYKGDGKNSVYENFLICDGSVAPTSLGVNPLLTISAITERAMDQLVGPPTPISERAKGTPAAPPPVQPEQQDVTPAGWNVDKIVSQLDKTRYAIDAIALASIGNFGFEKKGVRWALDELFERLLPGADLTQFLTDFTKACNLPDDLKPSLDYITDELKKLSHALTENKDHPVQPFLKALFEIAGDISPGFGFDESMQGYLSDKWDPQGYDVSDPYEIAEASGKAMGQSLVGEFTITAKKTMGHDVAGDLIGQLVGADLEGRVLLGTGPNTQTVYQVSDGRFDLLLPDPDRVETWLMTYKCKLQAEGEAVPRWNMVGTKVLRRDPGSFWWKDLTTLYVDLTPIDPSHPETPKQGIIRLDLQDLASQVGTITAAFDSDLDAAKLRDELMAAAKAGTLSKQVTDGTLLHKAFTVLLASDRADTPDTWSHSLAFALEEFFGAGIAATFGKLILRTYGGFISYMEDFPSESDATLKALPEPGVDKVHGALCEDIPLDNPTNGKIRMFHFAPADPATAKGPILLAPGMSTTSLSFALKTIDTSLVERLLADNYDVWLFDSRLSPTVTPVESDYSLDDVASQDWPTAVDYVLANTAVQGPGRASVQILGHCVGALTAQMALLGGHVDTAKVRQMIVMQFTVHPAASAFDVVKSEIGLAKDFSTGFPPVLASAIHGMMGDGPDWEAVKTVLEHGIKTIDPVSPNPRSDAYQKPLDEIHNTVDWNAPFGIDHVCYSPTCHRIYGLYGPVIAHENLNEATHNAMRQMFGEIATKPFVQLGLIMEGGRAVSAEGEDIYLPHYERLDMPFHVISGSINQIVEAESGFRTIQWLKDCMPEKAHQFTRTLVKGYAHNDCFIGKNANKDVFDGIMDVLRPFGGD